MAIHSKATAYNPTIQFPETYSAMVIQMFCSHLVPCLRAPGGAIPVKGVMFCPGSPKPFRIRLASP